MTNDPGERTTLASYRFIGAFSGGLFVTATANYLIDYFGKNGAEQATGFQWTVTVYAVIAAVLFMLTFAGTRERLQAPKGQKSSLKEDLKDLAKNKPWFIMLGASIAILIFNSLRDGSILYYFKYYVQDQTTTIFGKEYSFSHMALSSAYMSIWLATNIIGVILAKPISARLGKKKTFAWSAILSAIFSVLLFFIQPHQLGLIFLSNILIGVSAGIVLPLAWSMYADIADYSEWKSGRRATGLIFSSSSMSQKFGWTLGGAITGWLLAAFGFEANAIQSEEALLGIRLMISVIAGVGALVSFLFISFYKLDEAFMSKVAGELEKSRAAMTE